MATKRRESFITITDVPYDKNLVMVAKGSFIGEGFAEPRLDTLFSHAHLMERDSTAVCWKVSWVVRE